MEELTARQREVLEVILAGVEQEGRFPAMREIAGRLRLSSPATVFQHLEALAAKGFLRRGGGRWSLSPRSRRDRGVPIAGRVAAGHPLTAFEEIDGYLTPEFIGARRGRFSVRVRGESMRDEGILDGDYVVVDPEAEAGDGDLVVAYLGPDQEATVKRLRRRRGGLELHPANPEYGVLRVPRGDPHFRVAGRVVGLLRRM
ncbi:MAG: repressor LexA [Candidatus Eisenbacteria bacterium]|uniref:LexA repressor n=1 Tax=Eiseniibacteriota bacterium TaxID=2212470 RepID=A0A938BL00_UNCEI|nr:repressor LexA [Candidatus Eisenbacteria bacterium]